MIPKQFTSRKNQVRRNVHCGEEVVSAAKRLSIGSYVRLQYISVILIFLSFYHLKKTWFLLRLHRRGPWAIWYANSASRTNHVSGYINPIMSSAREIVSACSTVARVFGSHRPSLLFPSLLVGFLPFWQLPALPAPWTAPELMFAPSSSLLRLLWSPNNFVHCTSNFHPLYLSSSPSPLAGSATQFKNGPMDILEPKNIHSLYQ
jgi:hypothetical protein